MTDFLQYLLPVLSAVVAAYFTSRFHVHRVKADLEKEYQSRFNERRWEIYVDFATIIRQLLDNVKTKTNKPNSKGKRGKGTPESHLKMSDFNAKLWLIGSDDVIRAYLEWLRYGREVNVLDQELEDQIRYVDLLMDIVRAMRADLGNTESIVSSRDLTATIINFNTEYPLLRHSQRSMSDARREKGSAD